ncbi:MAG: helix-turn-helix transcriptional regulator, partial [Rhizobiales bacterium]|nr:helix-turn-helix transcriptional regulator [Hyphomicrobiales bacterium]
MARKQARTPSAAGRARGNARERILDAAVNVAHEVGPAHLSLDAVAERAGVSKGGLLYHFPTKQDLLKALVERHLAAIEAAVEVAPGGGACEGNDVALGHALQGGGLARVLS